MVACGSWRGPQSLQRAHSSQCPSLSSRKSSEELDMDKVTAAMVLTSLSTSPLVRSPPVRPNGKWSGGGVGTGLREGPLDTQSTATL